jgi:flagellar protein FliO/FliZ
MNIRHHVQMKRTAQVFVLCAAGLYRYSHASQTGATADVLSPGTMLQFALGLGTVLALIVAAGWVMKKSAFGKSAPGMIKVVAGAAVGQRERVVVVEVADVRMVLGVAPGRVTALHTMPLVPPPRVEENDTAGAAAELKAWLQDNKDNAGPADNAGAAAKLKAWLQDHKDAADPAPHPAPDESAGAAAKLKAWLHLQKEPRGAH